jgi:hypothetical protein
MTGTKNVLLASFVGVLLAAPLEAVVVPSNTPVRDKEYRITGFIIPGTQSSLSAIQDRTLASQLEQELAAMGVPASSALWDTATERWGSLFPAEPLIPGTGVRNTLRWQDLGISATPDDSAIKQEAWRAFTAYLERYQTQLRLDLSELGNPNIGVYDQGALVQIFVPRFVGGVLVRDAALSAVINHGNLVLLGFDKWGEVNVTTEPALSAEQARAVLANHASPFAFRDSEAKARTELIPLSKPAARGTSGLEYRLAWVASGRIERDLGNWEGLVDAKSGELLAFVDRNDYAVVKKVIGGVFPVSNDGAPPDGIEQPNYTIPFLNVTLPDGSVDVTSTGGVLGCGVSSGLKDRQLKTSLAGPYLRMTDTCGVANERNYADSELPFNLGSGPGTDCVVPPGHSAGDTHASRTGFYELNRLIEAARGYLPGNTWIRNQINANMNLNQTCNAFWDGASVNFFHDAGSQCRNTGEIAGIFDHEWGHGLDNNGLNPSIAGGQEAVADMAAILRLQDSCAGRGFFKSGLCSGYGDACVGTCSGVRDLDFAKHRCNLPHTITWLTNGFPTPQCTPAAPACPSGGGICGREVHCESAPAAEAAWDLFARDLQAPPFSFDTNTALERANRLVILGQQLVTSWYQCTPPFGGCGATTGYKLILAADDDNGDINDGTPHMTAIFAAHNRHETACATPAPVNSGCVGGPTAAPTVTATPSDQAVNLSWAPVAGAARYAIFRTEGVRGCNFGKAKVGESTGLTFTDSGLANGNTYLYSVLPIGANTSCFGRMSACVSAVPVPGPNARPLPALPIQAIGGDNDGVLDNCETARLTVRVENNGIVPLTNVRVLSAVSSTHPLTVPVTPLPATIATSLAPCASASGTIDVTPHGMTFNQTFLVTVTFTADQIAPATRSVTFTATGVETDFASVATRTYDFTTDLQGWTVTSGTFNRVDDGAGNFYLASSVCLDNQCDVVRSPVVRLTGTSTLSLSQRYDTEIPTPIPYDRANVGIFQPADASRVTVIPDGGKLYDLPPGAPNGVCGTTSQAGWSADTDADCTPPTLHNGFLASNWSANALNPGGIFTGKSAQISVNYGTDPAAIGWGFHFDAVTLTNFLEAIPDAQACVAPEGSARPAGAVRASKR